MNDYEILLMLDPDLPEERQEEIVKRTRDLIERGGGTWEGQDAWGRRKLAYPIEKKTDGVYHLLSFTAEGETLDEVSRVLKIDDERDAPPGDPSLQAGFHSAGSGGRSRARGCRHTRWPRGGPRRTSRSRKRSKAGKHQQRRARRQPDPRSGASAHAVRDGGLTRCGSR